MTKKDVQVKSNLPDLITQFQDIFFFLHFLCLCAICGHYAVMVYNMQ